MPSYLDEQNKTQSEELAKIRAQQKRQGRIFKRQTKRRRDQQAEELERIDNERQGLTPRQNNLNFSNSKNSNLQTDDGLPRPKSPQEPDEDVANRLRAGAPMNVSGGGTLAGGGTGQQENTETQNQPTDDQRQADKTGPKKNNNESVRGRKPTQFGQADNQGSNQMPGETDQGGIVSSPQQQAKKLLREQRKNLWKSAQKAEKSKAEHQKNVDEQKGWGRKLSSKMRMNRAERELKKQQGSLNKLEKSVEKVLHSPTNKLLKTAWLSQFAIVGIATELWAMVWYLYIVFHFLAAYFTQLSSVFGKFGREWLPQSVQSNAEQIPGAEKANERAAKALEILDLSGCALFGLLHLSVLLLILACGFVLAYAHEHPFLTLFYYFPYISWEAIKYFGGKILGVI